MTPRVLDRPFAAILFDMDGTLVDSTAAIDRSWTTWAVEHGVSRAALVAAAGHGRPAPEIVADLVGPERAAAASARITELEVDDVGGVVQLPGVADLLAGLPRERWAIVTSCSAPLADARRTAAGLPEPSVLVTFDDVERGKPAPDCFLLGARRLGVDPADCLVVEDAPAGLTAARAAGCATLAVRTTHPEGPLAADLVVRLLSEVAITPGEGGLRVSTRG
ncbi:HAD-IA family hydrolase [Kineococcus radiotolerans]|uniref:HAD-superfamily hydrolase, subfamily IA, variant 3 n=1 Tax=Kineococcus radiotolerans (strain ATCC BAA-149 / DSM 14245 / SRS30216) TaxID=266940 RepID=A6W827_KINRD|nr:HAD-IA family hydrolase [Kineococcus radiotolerans]ABS02966.1 HAD-superfamily hydrolase, subfamily IA, variant 3 [Kineococcus radiotolerans SRS30216 = ATCC BAA-149]